MSPDEDVEKLEHLFSTDRNMKWDCLHGKHYEFPPAIPLIRVHSREPKTSKRSLQTHAYWNITHNRWEKFSTSCTIILFSFKKEEALINTAILMTLWTLCKWNNLVRKDKYWVIPPTWNIWRSQNHRNRK
jgi:hypothetical protein